MTKNEFDKMLNVAILEKHLLLSNAQLSEIKKLLPSPYDSLCDTIAENYIPDVRKMIEELGVPPLTYEALSEQKQNNIQKSNSEESLSLWEQRRYDIAKDLFITIMKEYKDLSPAYSTEAKIKDSILITDKFISKLKG